MRLVKQIEQAALGPIYRLAIWLRGVSWRIRRPLLIGVRTLIVRDSAVLLIRHRSGKQPWALPGGGVERNERLAEAAWREAREEAGVPIRVERPAARMMPATIRGIVIRYAILPHFATSGRPGIGRLATKALRMGRK